MVDLWLANAADHELYASARFVYDLANKYNAQWDRVAKVCSPRNRMTSDHQ